MTPFPRLYMHLPIGTKLVLITLATIAAAMAVFTGLLAVTGYFYYREDLLRDLRAQTAIIAENSAAAVVFGDERNAREILGALRLSPDVDEGAIRTKDGRVLARFVRPDSPQRGDVPQDSTGGERTGWTSVDVERVIAAGDAPQGTVRIRASLKRVYMRVLEQLAIVWAIAVLSLALVLPLLAGLRRTVTDPIFRLVDVMTSIAQRRDYGQRARVEGRDEIGELAERFNQMLAVIERHQLELGQELQVRRRAEQQLDQLAHFDSVTHLPNRTYFNRHLQNAVARSVRAKHLLGLMFIDIDNFKVVNDTLGHDTGDRLLREIAVRLAAVVRAGDTICRFGGDEFAIVLEDLGSREDACYVADRVVTAVRAPVRVGEHEIYVTASSGIALCPDDAADVNMLLRQADTAMYQGKEAGKNRYRFYTDDMRVRAERRLTIEGNLRRALDQEEFRLFYQPIVDLESRRITAVEALLRWDHPELGLLGPSEFVEVAEGNGMIVAIGMWILYAACAQARAWGGLGHAIGVSVNLSSRQCRDADLAGAVRRALAQNDLPADRLTLELTELTLVDGSEATRDALAELDRLGVQIAIDDFGTGYSSMNYLRRFPISTLKLDRSLVHGVPGDADGEAIVEAIVAMGRSLGLALIAEGIEKEEQARYLSRYAPIAAQGYYFSHPLTAEQMTALLESGAGRLQLPADASRESPPA